MESENLFEEDFSEEVVPELDTSLVENNTEEDVANELSEEAETETNKSESLTKEATSNNAGDEVSASKTNATEQEAKLIQLPLTRIRNLMKLDPDLSIASNEAVFLVTRSTELFIESLARESFSYTAQAKKKTVQKRDVDLAISAVDSLMFLEGALNF